MADVLSFTIPTPARYASVNHLGGDGRRYGRKSAFAIELATLTREAARAEMERAGWITATWYVEVHWRRYICDRTRSFDPANALKIELDAMQPWEPSDRERADGVRPFPGVYANDRLVRPLPDLPQFDTTPGAIDRIAMVVFRLFPPPLEFDAGVAPTPARPATPKARRGTLYAGGPIPDGMAVSGRYLVPREQAIREITGAGRR